MSYHYSKYKLNTYSTTPYFAAHVPEDYPVEAVLIRSRAHRRLPPRLRKLAALAKRWAVKNYPHPAGIRGIEEVYDEEGYELNPVTKERLTDEEIDAEWNSLLGGKGADDGEEVEDIPAPPGGFADPDTWEPTPSTAEPDDGAREGPSADRLASWITSHGARYTARYYGIPGDWSDDDRDNEELVRKILEKMGRKQARAPA